MAVNRWMLRCQGGIIFCDLKPSNILFTEDEILKLSHFGQALRIEAVESQAPSRRGTPQYMAPELFSEAGFVRRGIILIDIYRLNRELFSC